MRLLLPLLMVGFKETEKLDGNGNEKKGGGVTVATLHSEQFITYLSFLVGIWPPYGTFTI